MFRVPYFGTRATHRRRKSAPPVVVVRDTMARRQRPSDSTQVMPAVTDATSILPVVRRSDPHRTVDRQNASAPLPPSQQPPLAPVEPWRPQVGGDGPWAGIATAVQHDRQARRILTEVATEAPVYAEDSYQSLAAYNGHGRSAAHRAAVALDDDLFRHDDTPGDRTLRAWMNRSDVLPAMARAARPRGEMTTQIITVVGLGQFSNDTYGKAAA